MDRDDLIVEITKELVKKIRSIEKLINRYDLEKPEVLDNRFHVQNEILSVYFNSGFYLPVNTGDIFDYFEKHTSKSIDKNVEYILESIEYIKDLAEEEQNIDIRELTTTLDKIKNS